MTGFRSEPPPVAIAVIGTGPRGISVLERLAVHLREPDQIHRRVRIYAIDAVELGAGRIWRTDQQPWFTMNTVIGQVTMYSGVPDGGPARPGAGPSLGEWIAERAKTHGEEFQGENDYATRLRYGQYLRDVYRVIKENLPATTELVEVRDQAVALEPRAGGGYSVRFQRTPTIQVDRVVIASGHPRNEPDDFENSMLDFAADHPGLHYLCGDSAADLPLDETTVPPGSTVGILGMGLSFYDVMLSLTIGRGGRFEPGPDSSLRYLPSGTEPHIVTSSRSGLPIPARGRNQKPPDHRHPSLFLTTDALTAARQRRLIDSGSPQLDFDEDVRPLLQQELDHVYRTAYVRMRAGVPAATRFAEQHAALLLDGADVAPLLAAAGIADIPPLDLATLARPFAGREFTGPDAFRVALLEVMRQDLAEADLGNSDGPLKAALDVLRDIRNVVRQAVDYGGLIPRSHRNAFLGRFLPVNALLSAGPPRARVRQLVALIEAGMLTVVGPGARFGTDPVAGRFRIESPQAGSARHADVLIDARIPTPALSRDTSPLIRQLLADGLIGEYVAEDPLHGERYRTGGLAITTAPYHVLDATGQARPDLYALGIPTEHTRWFTQVGSSRPGMATLFYRDADAIAADLLRGDVTAIGWEAGRPAPAAPAGSRS